MTGVSIILAGALQRDLMARGVRHLDFEACEALVAGMLRSIVTIERGTRNDEPPRRCATNEIDLDGSCMACGAAQGEACRETR
ncbi:hypothetical protein ACVWZL_003245 [Bradyrhizobium sp. GM2.4]